MTRLDEFVEAADEATWMCRLAESRLSTPADPPALGRYLPGGVPNQPWKFDYYSHVLAAQRLMHSADAINEILDDGDLAEAIDGFRAHWRHLRDLRNVLQHPRNTSIRWERDVRAFFDRIEYRLPGCDPMWVFTIEELHSPVEDLWAAVKDALERHRGGSRGGGAEHEDESPL